MSMNGCQAGGGSIELKPCLKNTPDVAATLGPAALEWTVSTRAACSVSNPILHLSCSPHKDSFTTWALWLAVLSFLLLLGIE